MSTHLPDYVFILLVIGQNGTIFFWYPRQHRVKLPDHLYVYYGQNDLFDENTDEMNHNIDINYFATGNTHVCG